MFSPCRRTVFSNVEVRKCFSIVEKPSLLNLLGWSQNFYVHSLLYQSPIVKLALPAHSGQTVHEQGVCSQERNLFIRTGQSGDGWACALKDPTPWWCVGSKLHRANYKTQWVEAMLGADWSKVRVIIFSYLEDNSKFISCFYNCFQRMVAKGVFALGSRSWTVI